MKPPGTKSGSASISRLGQRFADRRPKIPCLGAFDRSTVQNSNREGIRLETAVTQTKQRILIRSNREKEACSSKSKLRRAIEAWIAWRRWQHPRPHREGDELPPHAQQPQRPEKNRNRLTPKVLRLKRRPAICFVRVAANFNRTMLRLKLYGGEGEAKGKDDGGAENRAGLKLKTRPCNGHVKNAAIPWPTSESDAPVSPPLRPSAPA